MAFNWDQHTLVVLSELYVYCTELKYGFFKSCNIVKGIMICSWFLSNCHVLICLNISVDRGRRMLDMVCYLGFV